VIHTHTEREREREREKEINGKKRRKIERMLKAKIELYEGVNAFERVRSERETTAVQWVRQAERNWTQ